MICLRELFWLSEKYRFIISAVHIKGEKNELADMLSRLHIPSMAKKFMSLMQGDSHGINFYRNMTEGSFLYFQEAAGNSAN